MVIFEYIARRELRGWLDGVKSVSELLEALRDSAPVMLGYVPLGMAFGLLFQSLGYHYCLRLWQALLFMRVQPNSWQLGYWPRVSYAEAFIATLLLNSRHIFYGLSVFDRYPERGLSRCI